MLCADALVNIFLVFVHLVAVAVIENFQKAEGFRKRDIVVVCKIQKTASKKQSAFDFSAVRSGDSAKISEIEYVVRKNTPYSSISNDARKINGYNIFLLRL